MPSAMGGIAMNGVKVVRPEILWLKDHPQFTERWVQDQIAADPSILGLGDLELKDKERRQPRAGRLDLLLQDPDSNRRYEAEIQLGATDESHIIRTIEYWDTERRRYPQYDHCAVIVAEDITARFLNVISLFNGTIPLIAIQMRVLKLGDQVALMFTTVLDELTLGLVDEDEEIQETVTRDHWENKAAQTIPIVDRLLEMIHTFDPDVDLKYNRHYIGLAENGQPNNYIVFRPKKKHVGVNIRLKRTEDIDEELDRSGLDLLEYDKKWNRYRLRVVKDDLTQHRDLLTRLMQRSYDVRSG
jgi:hypothetical protein